MNSAITNYTGSNQTARNAGTGARNRWLPQLTMLLIVSSILGCTSSPIVPVSRPVKQEVSDYSLDYAITYANVAREAYQKAIRAQTDNSTHLGSALITIGAAALGFAAFDAHKDALIGAVLAGGTLYSLGNWNLNKSRPLIYQAGIDGVNCAVRAVTPIYATAREIAELGTDASELERKIGMVQAAMAEVRAQQKGSSAGAKFQVAMLDEARTKSELAARSATAARTFMTAYRRAGPELVVAIDRIIATVDRMALETVPDLAAIPKIVGGLAALSEGFAPGSGIAKQFEAALGRYGGAQAKISKLSPALDTSVTSLLHRLAEMEAARITVDGKMAGRDSAASTAKLVDCGVTGVHTALSVMPSEIEVKTEKESASLIIASGGASTLYTGVFLNGPPDGLSLRAPLPGERSFQVVGTQSLKETGTFTVMISDAAGKASHVSVRVIKSEEKPSDMNSQSNKSIGDNLLAEIKSIGKVTLNSVDFSVVPAKSKNLGNEQGIEVFVVCLNGASPQAKTEDIESAFYSFNEDNDAVSRAAAADMTISFRSDDKNCVVDP